MDKDRIVGSGKQIKGAVKQVSARPLVTPSWSRRVKNT